MALKELRDVLTRAEEIAEDVILMLLSIFIIVLAVAALAVLSTQPAALGERAAMIGAIATLGFLAKAEYFAALLMPWMVIIIGLLIGRELWLLRRRMEGIHFEVILHRIGTKPKTRSRGRKR